MIVECHMLNVSRVCLLGHIHPGQGQNTALLDLVMETPNQTKAMKFLRGKWCSVIPSTLRRYTLLVIRVLLGNTFFGDPKNPRSPVYRQIEQVCFGIAVVS